MPEYPHPRNAVIATIESLGFVRLMDEESWVLGDSDKKGACVRVVDAEFAVTVFNIGYQEWVASFTYCAPESVYLPAIQAAAAFAK